MSRLGDVHFYSIVLLLACATAIYSLLDLNSGSVTDPIGERGFPVGVSLLIALIAAGSIVHRLLMSHRLNRSTDVAALRYPIRRTTLAWAALLSYPLFLPLLGFVLTSFGIALAILLLVGMELFPKSISFAFVLTAALYLIFAQALSVDLPDGRLLPYLYGSFS